MIEYKDTMVDVTEQDVNYWNASVNEINEKMGREFIELKSTPDDENYCIDIFEDGLETWSGYTFEETEMYLKGIKLGLNAQTDKKPAKGKVTLELTDKQFAALAELLAATAAGGYKRTRGDHTITEARVQFVNGTFNILKRLERKVNG